MVRNKITHRLGNMSHPNIVVANCANINYMIFKISGKMIGKKGETVKQFKNETKCSITLQERNDNTQTRYKDNRR